MDLARNRQKHHFKSDKRMRQKRMALEKKGCVCIFIRLVAKPNKKNVNDGS